MRSLLLVLILATAAQAETYTVKKGDTLGHIAQRKLGRASRWRKIYRANAGTISNPNVIRVGQKLTIPERWMKTGQIIPKGYKVWKVIPKAKVTAYTPSWDECWPFADGKTSTGRNAWKTHGVAVDPKVIPYNSLIDIPGVGLRRADDTGGAMRRSTRRGIYHIDVRSHSYKWARRWGRPWLPITVYVKA